MFRFPCSRRPVAPSMAIVAFGLATAAAAVDPPVATAIAPNAGFSGDSVVIRGTDLDGPDDRLLVWVRTSTAGFLFDDVAASGGGASATVGPVGSAATGQLQVWSGRRIALAPTTTRIDNRLLSALDAQVFIGHQTSSRGPLFSALAGSSATLVSGLIDNTMVIDFGPLFPRPPGSPGSIRVDAVIETGGSKTGASTSGGSGGSSGDGDLIVEPSAYRAKSGAQDEAGPALAFHVVVAIDSPFDDSAEASAAERTVSALADVLGESFASLGLSVSADGSRLVLDTVGGVRGGFVTVAVDP